MIHHISLFIRALLADDIIHNVHKFLAVEFPSAISCGRQKFEEEHFMVPYLFNWLIERDRSFVLRYMILHEGEIYNLT